MTLSIPPPSDEGAAVRAAIDELRDTTVVEDVSWKEFLASFAWKQGEHVGLIGPTGAGKTTLALSLLKMRKYVAIFATKPKDSTLDTLLNLGYKKYRKWSSTSPKRTPRRILWPNARDLYAAQRQRTVFQDAFERIYREGGWCVYLDELWMMVHSFGLEHEIRTYLQQARSLNISLVCATQRPKRVPVEIFDQSSHLFFWRDNDEMNLSRISGIAWLNSALVRETVANLEQHQVLYIYTRNSDVKMQRFFPPPPKQDKGKQ